MTIRPPAVLRAVALVAVTMAAGCAAHHGGGPKASLLPKPPEQQTLDDLQPPIKLPAPTTQPSGEAPAEALVHYAQGRDALLRNQKTAAIKELSAAVEIDPDSAIVWRDLGYARLGIDDARAALAFRTACGLDPDDADSRLQLARLLLAKKQNDAAVEQLRLARLSPEFESDAGLAAVVDILLGGCLEAAGRNAAALDCDEQVLSVLDDGNFTLRGRPELAELLSHPGSFVLRTADLAVLCGRNDRAITLYQRLQQQEPQLGRTLDMRLARAEMANGDLDAATKRAFNVVWQAGGTPVALAQFDDLFAPYGGSTAALDALAKNAGADADTGALLRSHELLIGGRAREAAAVAEQIRRSDLPVVRQLVKAHLAAKTKPQLLIALVLKTRNNPGSWKTIERGWQMLTHFAQNDPVRPEAVEKIDLGNAAASATAARDYIAAKLYEAEGRQASARRLRQAAEQVQANAAEKFDLSAADNSIGLDLNDLEDVTSSKELSILFDDYRDDPDLLAATVAGALRAVQRSMVLDALESALAAHPTDPSLCAAYAQVLVIGDERGEASRVMERAVSAATAAPPLYFLASQFNGLGDDKASERVLRLAYAKDGHFAPACNDLGYLLTEQGRELDLAEQLLTTAATMEPDNAAYLDSFGWLLYKRSKFDAAVKYLEQAVAMSTPTDPVVLDHAADALYQAKQPDRSADLWQQAVDAIKEHGTADPQLRLRIEQKLRQLKDKTPVVVAPVAKAE